MPRLRLLWVSDSPTLNTGFAKVTRELLARLSRDPRYEIACFGWFYSPESDLSQSIPYPVFPADSQTYGQSNFQQIVAHFRPQVVVTLGDVWMVDWIADLQCRRNFIWVGYVPIDGQPLPTSWADVLDQMDQVVTMSQFGLDVIAKACPTLSPKLIPLGVDTSVFRPLPHRESLREQKGLADRFVVGCVARNQPRKQLPLLLQAFARLHRDFADSLLYLHTDPDDEVGWDLQALLSRYHLSDEVLVPSDVSAMQGVSESELNEICNLFDVFALPTMSEGFGLPLLESMAAGVPVIATDCSSCRELVEGHGELIQVKAWLTTAPYGIEYALADVEHLEEILRALREEASLRTSYGDAGCAFAQQYAWDQLIPEWHSLLNLWKPKTMTTLSQRFRELTESIQQAIRKPQGNKPQAADVSLPNCPLDYRSDSLEVKGSEEERSLQPTALNTQPTGRVYLITRTIPGLGDAVMLEPLISLLAEQIGREDVLWLQLPNWIAPIYEGHPAVARLVPEGEIVPGAQPVLTIVDKSACPCAAYESKHSPEILKNRDVLQLEAAEETLGWRLPYDGRGPRLYLNPREQMEVEALRRKYSGVRVGIQLRTADRWRDYLYTDALIAYLRDHTDWHLFLYDHQQAPAFQDTIPVVGLPIRDVMMHIAAMSLMVCPDSGLAHVAGALRVPLYALYGPTEPRIRLEHYTGKVYWPERFKCPQKRRCWYQPCQEKHCLSSLKPRSIYHDLRKILER